MKTNKQKINELSNDVSIAWQHANQRKAIMATKPPLCDVIAEELYAMNYIKLPCKLGETKYAYSKIEKRIIQGTVSGIWVQNGLLVELNYDEDCYDTFFPEELYDTKEQVKEDKTND